MEARLLAIGVKPINPSRPSKEAPSSRPSKETPSSNDESRNVRPTNATADEALSQKTETSDSDDEFTGEELQRIMYFASVLRSSQDDDFSQNIFSAWKEYVGEMQLSRAVAANATPFFILHPQGKLRFTFDFFGALFIMYDCFSIPLVIAFEQYTEPWALAALTLGFWTLEMFSNFSTGFYDKDEQLVTSRSRIAVRHIKTWFIVDALTLGPEYFERLSSAFQSGDAENYSVSHSHVIRILRGGRFLRLIRLVRLLRLAKLQKILKNVSAEFLQYVAEWVPLVLNVASMQIIFAVWMHFVGCIWHAIGSAQEKERTWIKDFEEREERDFEGITERYLVSVHWAYSQITPTTSRVSPQNTNEHFWQFAIVSCSLVAISVFVSRTTVAITRLYDLREVTESRFEKLRKYLSENKIERQLSHRITVYLKARLARSRSLTEESKVDLLALLPDELVGELRRAIIYPRLKIYTLLNRFFQNKDCHVVSRLIATKAASLIHALQDEQIFTNNEVARGMYFLNAGLFDLTTSDLKSYKIGPTSELLADKGYLVYWLAEFSLIMPWVHKDRVVVACQAAELVVVSRAPLMECLESIPKTKELFLEEYLKRFERIELRCNGRVGDWAERDKQEAEVRDGTRYLPAGRQSPNRGKALMKRLLGNSGSQSTGQFSGLDS
jgi:hypothetical protein